MRLKMVFQLQKPEMDIEYRRAFLSLLKSSFMQASPEIYEKFYGPGVTMKPFTFGVFLVNPEFEDQRVRLKSADITLNFSTYYSDLGIHFYNSLIKNRSRFQAYPLADGNEMRLKRVSLQRERLIWGDEAVFKTLSPFLVRLHHKEDNLDEYLTALHNLFIPKLEENIRVLVSELLGRQERLEFTPVTLKVVPVKHYGQIVEGNVGVIKLKGNPEVLDFIYKVGLGSRRSEGFGLLELV